MKRPRESIYSNYCGENDIIPSLSSIESMAEAAADQGLTSLVALSARGQESRQHRNQRYCTFLLPKNLLLVASLVAALAFSGMAPTAHALSSTNNMSFAHSASADRYDFLRHRRTEEKDTVADAATSFEECTIPVTKCMECTFSEQKAFDACKETGKWQKFKCVLPSDTEESEEEEGRDDQYETMSCKHTDFDNGIAMFQFQIFCLLIGGLSIVSVKKQKKVSMSMFDRRKQHGSNASRATSNVGSNKRSDGDEEENIEFTPMTNQQRERVPLVARMEVI